MAELLGTAPEGITGDNLLDLVEGKLQDRNAIERAHLSPVVTQVIESVVEQLRSCPDFTHLMRVRLEPVIVSTVRFLARCMDMQKGGETGRAAYLRDPNAKEQELQDDLIDWYRGNEHDDPYIEPQDIGGGRVEILFPVNGDRFVVELKRERANATRESLSKYLAQPAAYEATSICIGMLVVLDLTSEGLPAHLRDNVWVEQVPSPESGGADRFVIVIRIPGNKRSPSRLKPGR